MQVTRRFRTVAGMALVLVTGAVVLERPVLLAGALGVGAWLLAHQYRFVRNVERTTTNLSVGQSLGRRRVVTDEAIPVVLSVTSESGSALVVEAESNPPVSTTGSTAADRQCRLAPGGRESTTAFTLESPVAGAFTFSPPTLRLRDSAGLFEESLSEGPAPTVVVDPRTPHDIHVGEGGDRVAAAYGEHESGRLGSGLEPAEVREYVPGDAAARIDWKATARLGDLYVREFEAETDRTTVLLVDHRSRMGQGRTGMTKLDYAREAALGLVEHAEDLSDPLGLFGVGDGGITTRRASDASKSHYRTVRDDLRTLVPTADEATSPSDSTPDTTAETRVPASARTTANRLARDISTFGKTLTPYFAASRAYLERIDGDPLFATTRSHVTRLPGSVFTVIITDDGDRSELREAVRLARRGDDAVLVLLTPTVLFEPGALADLERAYERYLDFEEFRRSLARLDRVRAYEIAPGDRLGAILAARRNRRTSDREVHA